MPVRRPPDQRASTLTEGISDIKRTLGLHRSFAPGMRMVVVMRHSERVPFKDVPRETWDQVGITENGHRLAREFGRALAGDSEHRRANVYSWGQKRCAETAAAISEGMADVGLAVERPPRSLTFESPVADRVSFNAITGLERWDAMLDSWQRGDRMNGTLKPIAEYSPSVLREILHPRTSPSGSLSVVVTHDFHVLPLASHAVGRVVPPPDYLDGIVIGEREGTLMVGYRDIVRSTDLATLTG